MKYLMLAINAQPSTVVFNESDVDEKLVNGSQIIEKPVMNTKIRNTHQLLRLEVKQILNSFYDQYLEENSICSERLNDVYDIHIYSF